MPKPFSIFQSPGLKELSTMIPIEGGTFLMGTDDENARHNERPAHKVKLSNFAMGKYPVTQALWQQVINENRSYFKGQKRPVEQVSWYDAVVFCNILNKQCGYTPCYFSDEDCQTPFYKSSQIYEFSRGEVFFKMLGNCYRLPTEAEWEYTARGGQNSMDYNFVGGNKINEVAWYAENSHNETKLVGLKLPNELGLYDMSGNIWEWCWDWGVSLGRDYFKECAALENGLIENPRGFDTGLSRVLRGGSWNDDSTYFRSSYRGNDSSDERLNTDGFRLVFSFFPV